MTMYVVAGDGEMAAADLKATLDDLENQAVADKQTFWLTVRASAEPTATDRALMAWLAAHECYYETYGPDANSADDIYKGTQEKHAVKGVTAKIVQLMQEKPEEGEDAYLLALFASDDTEDVADAELYKTVEAVLSAGFSVMAFNDGLAPIELTEAPAEEAVEEAAEEPVAAADTGDADDEVWATQENLEKLSIDEIKVIATRFGIELPPRTRSQTYITAILERNVPKEPEAEVEVETVEAPEEPTMTQPIEPTHTNGTALSPLVKDILRGLGQALLDAAK